MSNQNQTLVLAADFQPIKIVSWDEAFAQVLKKAAILVHEHDNRRVRAGTSNFNGEDKSAAYQTGIDALRTYDESGVVIWKRPSVIKEVIYHKRKRIVRFSRESVWLRDGGVCQYCLKQCSRHNFTFDHTIPRSKGGKTNFDNIVVSCVECNQKKGGKTPAEAGMKLHTQPLTPKSLPNGHRRFIKISGAIPEEWAWYLGEQNPEVYWNIEIENNK